MIRHVLAAGLAAAALALPAAAEAQLPPAGNPISSYSDTIPKHRGASAKATAKKAGRKGHAIEKAAAKDGRKAHKSANAGKSAKKAKSTR